MVANGESSTRARARTGASCTCSRPGAAPPAPGTTVEAALDWERRHAHMRMHTCLHLLGSVLRYGVTGGQIAADKGRLDFDTQDEIDKEAVTAAVNALVGGEPRRCARSGSRTRNSTASPNSCARCPCSRRAARAASACSRSRAWTCSPAAARTWRRTGEIGPVVVTKVESKGKRNKRVYIAFA